jgi:drug/metabolite transporter (DMT)-like permease
MTEAALPPMATVSTVCEATAEPLVAEKTKITPPHEHGLFHPSVLIPFLLVSLIWGSTWLVIKGQLGSVPPSWSVTYRFTLAAISMFALTLVMRQSLTITRRAHGWAMVIGFVQFGLNFNFVYAAEEYITSGLVAVLFAMLIVPNALLGKLWLGRPVARAFWLGSAIATIGVALLILREYRFAPVDARAVLIGAGLTLIAVVTASISNVLQASHRLAKFPITTVLAWSMFYGAIGNAIWSAINHGAPQLEWTPRYLGGIAYLAIVGSVVTFPLYFKLVREIGPGKAAYTSVFIPVVAMGLSTVFEGYVWSSLAAAGAALVMAGMFIAMQAAKPAR